MNVMLKYWNAYVLVKLLERVNEVVLEEFQVEHEVVHDFFVLLVVQLHRSSLIVDVIVDQKEAFL